MSKFKLCDNCEYTNNCSYKNIKPKSNDLTKIIESTFDYAKKCYPDKYEPFELHVYPDEIARTIVENGYRKVKE